MRVSKLHGLRNDFLVVLDEANPSPVAVDGDLARRVCDRRSGLGADGLIHGARPAEGSDVDVVMHLFNADGGRAEMSGNGIRCLAHAVARSRRLARGTIVAATDAGRRELVVEPTGDPRQVVVRVDMGLVRPGPDVAALALPLAAKEVDTADVGNPHVVAWLDDAASLAAVDLAVVGPEVESHHPGGINLELVVPGPGPDTLQMRVWERGAGITEACGTGACAAAHLAHRWGIVGSRVTVEMPGGSVLVELVDGRAVLHGPSVLVADLDVGEGVALDG